MTLISRERAIMFADVSGSTTIYELLGDKPAAQMIEGCLGALREIVARYGGTVVKTIGDEIMVVFPGAAEACEAAKTMQNRVSVMPPVSGVKLAIRVGFHFGHVLEEKGDFFGDGVNTAARLASLARGGQILTSATAIDVLPAHLKSGIRDLQNINVKGKQEAVRVFEIIWEESDDSTQIAAIASSAKVQAEVQFEISGRRFGFPSEKSVMVLGRDPACDIVLKEKTASRRHAKIERRGVQYYLVDESTNGTYMLIEGDREVLLKRDAAPLRGRGRIALGVRNANAAEVLIYECTW